MSEDDIEEMVRELLVAICALSQTAVAQTSECQSIANAGARLACYDRVDC